MRHITATCLCLFLLTACSHDERPRSAGAPDPSSLAGPTRKPSGRLAAAWSGLVFDNGLVSPAVATTAGPDPKAAAELAATGRRELTAGHAVAAIAAFTEAILARPNAPDPFVELGQGLLLIRERARAEAAFRTALALEPRHPDAHDRLARLLYLQGDREQAVVHWQEAVASDPELASAHLRLAAVYYYQGATELAAFHLESARITGAPVPATLSKLLAGDDPLRARVRHMASESLTGGTPVRIDPGGGTAMAAETAIAAGMAVPGELVAAWNDLRESPVDGFWRLGVGASIDGGQTWSDFVIRPPIDFQTPHEGDPMTAHDPRTGSLWVGGTAFFDSIFVARKIPGSTSFEPAVIAYQGSFVDKGWLAAGPPPGEPTSTHLYLAHNEGFQVSDDLGATWSLPLPLGNIISPLPRVTPSGEVYISSWEFFGTKIWLHRSFDGGASLDGPRLVATRLDVWDTQAQDHTPGQYRVAPLPVSAVDPNDGTLYCVYPDTTDVAGAEYNVDLYFTRSDNQGLDWSPVRIVNGDSDPPEDQFFPWLEVDAAGRLHLAFFDTRRSQQSDADPNGLIDVYYSFSDDRGSTWTERRLTPVPFDTSLAEWPGMGQFLGDFIGLSVAGDQVYVTYPSTENGDLDIFVQAVTSDVIFADGFESGDLSAWSSTSP